MFTVSKDATLMRGAAGEAIVVRVKLAKTAGVYEDMIATGTSLVFVLYEGATEHFYANANLVRANDGVYAEFVGDGNVTEKLRGKANISGELAKRGSRNSRTTLTSFMVQIVAGAPRIESYDNGQIADYATLIVRTFNPEVPDTAPSYEVSIVPYVEQAVAPSITLGTLAVSNISATVGVSYTSNITGAISGSTLTATNLPAGLTLNSAARTISGTPTTAGTLNFTLVETLAGASNSPKINGVTLTIAAAPVTVPTLGTLSLSNTTGQVGTAFNASINGATNGSTLSSSNLPAGLTLNSSARTISGTPTATASSFTLIETLSGATGSPKSNTITLTISAAPVAATTSNTLSNSNLLPSEVSGAHDYFTAREARISRLETAFAS